MMILDCCGSGGGWGWREGGGLLMLGGVPVGLFSAYLAAEAAWADRLSMDRPLAMGWAKGGERFVVWVFFDGQSNEIVGAGISAELCGAIDSEDCVLEGGRLGLAVLQKGRRIRRLC